MSGAYLTDGQGYYILDFCPVVDLSDFASCLLDGRLWFGKYPTTEELRTIAQHKFTHIINLCTPAEVTWEPYVVPRGMIQILYPFEDGTLQRPLGEKGSVDEWTTFNPFIQKLVSILSVPRNKVYIHCKGGHGRSPTVCAIVCGILEHKDPKVVINDVRDAHRNRRVMDPKWRKLGAPQRAKQKRLIEAYLSSSISMSVTRRTKEKAKDEFIEAMNKVPGLPDERTPNPFDRTIVSIKEIDERAAHAFLVKHSKLCSEPYKEFKSHSHGEKREIEICRCWLHVKKNWVKSWYEEDVVQWNQFVEFQGDETRKKDRCPGCGELCVSECIYTKGNVCNLCDDRIQPFIANPKNRYLVRMFLESWVDDLLPNI